MIDITKLDASLALEHRAYFSTLLGLEEPGHGFALIVTIGPPEKPGRIAKPLPEGIHWMAEINVGDKLPIVIKGLRPDPDNPGQFVPGELGGPSTFEVQDASVVEVIEENGTSKAVGLAQGSSTIKSHTPAKAGGVVFESVGLVVVNDPADDATLTEMEFGPVEPAPAA